MENPTTPGVPERPQTFARMGRNGLIEIIDVHTGRVVGVQSTADDLLKHAWDRLIKIDTPQGPVWIERGINFDIINHLRLIPYSQVLGDLICEAIVNGDTLKVAVARLGGGVTYSDVMRWRRENDSFRLGLEEAKRERTEAHHDEVLQISKEASKSARIAALQWSAEKNNPEKYGAKVKHSGDSSQPIVFKLDTGIRRDPTAQITGQTQETPGVLEEREAKKALMDDIPDFGGSDDG